MATIASWLLRTCTAALLSGLTTGCVDNSSIPSTSDGAAPTPSPFAPSNAATLSTEEILRQSWSAYKARFIQSDGRVVDWEADARTVSEGQAYAMLRAVLADDPETFALTLAWAENNLRRQGEVEPDRLWAWKWGQRTDGSWGIIDENFASDADVDAITALILASRQWHRPEYLQLAQAKLQDLWTLSTIASPANAESLGTRYFLPGPIAAFQPQPTVIYLNPSYLAPYAFRLFAQVDKQNDWTSLIDSSYDVLFDSAALSTVQLPSDWVALNITTGTLQPLPESASLKSFYSFDAYRVWWRVSLDLAWFDAPQAKRFLQQHLIHLQQQWEANQSLPARIDRQGKPLVSYEAIAQYSMLYPAFQAVDPPVAAQMLQQKLLPAYQNGIWENNSAYYVQNLAWLGLFPADTIASELLQPTTPELFDRLGE